MEIPDDVVASVVPVKDDGLMDLTDFVEKARAAVDDMADAYALNEPQSLDDWIEDFKQTMHNT